MLAAAAAWEWAALAAAAFALALALVLVQALGLGLELELELPLMPELEPALALTAVAAEGRVILQVLPVVLESAAAAAAATALPPVVAAKTTVALAEAATYSPAAIPSVWAPPCLGSCTAMGALEGSTPPQPVLPTAHTAQ